MHTAPAAVPQAHKSAVTNRFCLRLLFARNSTASPTPAEAHSPATAPPNESCPAANSCVMSTLAAQFGTRPTSAASAGCQ